jgi:hypothetical protein
MYEELNINPYTPVVSLLTTLVRLLITVCDGGYHPRSTTAVESAMPSWAGAAAEAGKRGLVGGVAARSRLVWP